MTFICPTEKHGIVHAFKECGTDEMAVDKNAVPLNLVELT